MPEVRPLYLRIQSKFFSNTFSLNKELIYIQASLFFCYKCPLIISSSTLVQIKNFPLRIIMKKNNCIGL